MTAPLRVLLLIALLVGPVSDALAQAPKPGRPSVGTPPEPHRVGELDCVNCHTGKHRGVLEMYLGMGGRGTPMIPSHMFQVRVECVACHIVPKEGEVMAGMAGQTFRPSELACVGCHGERYRGMLDRWTETLARMQGVITVKVAAGRAALSGQDPKDPKFQRARRLLGDAEHNLQFVALGRGVHNVFYAADLLKLANGWLDEGLTLLGKRATTDDTLVRGGYCAALCHEQAGVKQSETVRFGKAKVPHVRHVTEFGAVCTTCHSPEVHKAVTATPAACTACHHSRQNERCESCHSVQSRFYRGQVKAGLAKIEPNVMANAVSCTGCHDLAKRHSRQAVEGKCVGCHDPAYTGFMSEWTGGLDREVTASAAAIKRAEEALARARRAGHKALAAEGLLRQAREALDLVRRARGVHNPPLAGALLDAARRKAEEARAGGNRP